MGTFFEGLKIENVDVFEMIPPDEGDINIYYGRIGGGKTSAGTRNILRELKQGKIVIANWRLKWEGWDERKSFLDLLMGVLGLQTLYFNIPKENFHFWNFTEQELDGKPCGDFIDTLSALNDCSIHLDEGHIPFDSYEATRMSEKKRSSVFATRHFNRKLTVYTQRANSVHINLRGNTNRFFKCEKDHDFSIFGKRFIKFRITEFQDLTSSSTVDETREKDENGNEVGEYLHAVSSETYWGSKRHFALFDSKYLRKGAGHSQENLTEIYHLTWRERAKNLWKILWNK